jgi:hypothetical protein
MGVYYGGGVCPDNTTQLVRPMTRSSLRLCNCGLIHVYYLSVSFSYLRSAVGVSFDIKKACRKPYKDIFCSEHISWYFSLAVKYFAKLKTSVFAVKKYFAKLKTSVFSSFSSTFHVLCHLKTLVP